MKTKLLFWSAILFFALGLNAKEGALFYFFSIHLLMLFIGVALHNLTKKLQSDQTAVQPLPETADSGKN